MAAGWLLTACSSFAPPSANSPLNPPVLLVTFDTTRSDHVDWAREPGRASLTPNLAAMAARGTTFTTCITSQPLTLPAHTSILTGLYPYHHATRNNGTFTVPDRLETLAERLKAAGYATHAVVSSFVLDSQFGLDQGFETYDDDLSSGPAQKLFMFRETPADLTTDRALTWLQSTWDRKRPFFLWVHYFDPHADYTPPQEVAEKFPESPYEGEIHFADRELGRLLSYLEGDKLLKKTLFVFTADHGEGLGEHGEKTHGMFLYDATAKVPLLIAGPSVPARSSVPSLVRTVDIVPTLLDFLRLSPSAPLDGRSLRPLWQDETETPRDAYLETLMPQLSFGWSELRALRTQTLKAILAPRRELYLLSTDPLEKSSLMDLPAEGGELFASLQALEAADPFPATSSTLALSDETRRNLEALGYVMSAAPPSEGPSPDPKDRIQYWEQFQVAQALIRRHRLSEAVELIEALLQSDPDNLMARSSLGSALATLGDTQRALLIYQDLITRAPSMTTAYLSAAGLLRQEGRYEEAAQLARQVVELQPANPEGLVSLGDTALEQSRLSEAEGYFRQALALDPHSALATAGLGNCLNREGRLEEAAAVLEAGVEKDRSSYAMAYNLGVVYDRMGKGDQSLTMYRRAIQISPEESMAWNNLGSLLTKHGKQEDGLRAVQKAVALDATNGEAAYNLGSLLLASGKALEALPHLEQACRRVPTLEAAFIRRAQALEAVGRWEEAVALLEAREHPGSQIVRASVLSRAGKKAEALQALETWAGTASDDDMERARRDPSLEPLISQLKKGRTIDR